MSPPLRPRVDDLIRETATLTDSLGAIVQRSPISSEDEVWLIYARTERTVAKLKYRLGTERPGIFSELPASKLPEEFLTKALEHLRHAGAEMISGRPVEGLEALRSARMYLRAYLAEQRRARMRERRRATLLSRRPSSSPSSPP